MTPRRRPTVRLVITPYRPWKGQAWIHRSTALFRTAVCARQTGKSHAAAFDLLAAVLWRSTKEDARHAAVLAPTYKIAKSAIMKLREFAGALDQRHVQWREQDKELRLPGGRLISVFSADRKEAVRGPTLCMLWIDEGAYLHPTARDAALGTLAAVRGARTLTTTTPAGKGWVYDDFMSRGPNVESFRFRTEDSPYANRELVAHLRARMAPEKARQEFDAEFVDSLLLAFPEGVEVVDKHPTRTGDPGNVIGLDIARDQDWTVATLMNRWGDATILGRRQKSGTEATFYPQTVSWVAGLAERHGATVCIDGSGAGTVVADYLERDHKVKVVRVSTHVVGTKALMVEAARAEVQAGRIRVLRGENTDQLLDEMLKFQGLLRVQHGQAVMVYEGLQGRANEFDDCVISLCLANYARVGQSPERVLDFSGFYPGASAPAPGGFGDWGPVVG